MKQRFFQRIFDVWIVLKIKLKIPLPIKNHFYRGHRISIKRNWFCTNCNSVFHLRPWKEHKDQPAKELSCPHCRNKSILWSHFIFKAIVDGKSKKYINSLINQNPNYHEF